MKKKARCQRFLCMFLACLLTVSGMVLPAKADGGMIYVAHPGTVFGEPEKIAYNPTTKAMDYFYDVSWDPQERLEELIDIQEEYGMTLEKKKKSLFGGDWTVVLSFGEDLVTCLWDKSEKQLTVAVDVDLRTEWLMDEEEIFCWYVEDQPVDYLKSQITILEETYGLQYDGSERLDGGGMSLLIGSNGEVRYDWYKQQHLFVATYKSDWYLTGTKKSEESAEPKENTVEESTAQESTADGYTLPSFLEFDANNLFTRKGCERDGSIYTVNYGATDPAAVDVAKDYIRMLRNQENCTVVADRSSDKNDWYMVEGILDHPADVTSRRLEATNFYDYTGDVYLSINYLREYNSISFCIKFVEGLKFADYTNGGGDGGGGGGTSCSSCGGDGKCNTCGGDGRVYTPLAGTGTYVEQNCVYCNRGSCRACGGSGKN